MLSALRRSGAPYQLSPSQLIGEMMVTSGTMTNRIDRLVSAGWVSRHPDPTDRRGVLVRLTEAGQTKVDDSLAELLVLEAELLGQLSAPQRRKLSELLRQLSSGFDAEDE